MAALLAVAALASATSVSAVAASGDRQGPGRPSLARGYPVKVYFSRHPISDDHYGAVFPVKRVSPTLGVATFAIRQLLAGPTKAEVKARYYTELTQYYHGPSNCGPMGFTIRLNRRGAAYDQGTATLQLCRRFTIPGVGTSARIAAEMRATLLQFPSIKRVVILTANGSCFGDLSGSNICLWRTS